MKETNWVRKEGIQKSRMAVGIKRFGLSKQIFRPVLHVRINHHGDYGYGSKYQAKSINDLQVWGFNPPKKINFSANCTKNLDQVPKP